MLEMQRDNMKVDIYNMKQTIRFTQKQKSSADPKTQSQMSKTITGQKKQVKQLYKDLNYEIQPYPKGESKKYKNDKKVAQQMTFI